MMRWSDSLFASNFSIPDGKSTRHFVETRYQNGTLHVTIDKKQTQVSRVKVPWRSSWENEFFGLNIGRIGYKNAPQSIEPTGLANFKGCISNLQIKSEDEDEWPLENYKNGEEYITFGLPKLGPCFVFSHKAPAPIFYDFSRTSDWKHPELDIVPVETFLNEMLISTDNPYTSDAYNDSTTLEPELMSAKIWPWALLGCLLGIILLLSILFLLSKYCSTEPDELAAIDQEAAKEYLRIHQQNEPRAKEVIPLLPARPAVPSEHQQNSHQTESSYGLTPPPSREDQMNQIEEINEEPAQLHLETEPISSQLTRELEADPVSFPLNSINRDSNTKIPFKNQLSEDSNSLRHIDSSSEDSFVTDHDTRSLPGSPSTPHLNKQPWSASSPVGLEDIEQKIINTPEPDDIDSGTIDPLNPSQQMEMQKFYLIRKHSEPPKLPPKRK